jgi:hypothetical protein
VLAATGKKKKMQKEMSSSGDVTSVAQDDAIEIL